MMLLQIDTDHNVEKYNFDGRTVPIERVRYGRN